MSMCRARATVRPAAELAGCSGDAPEEDPNTSLFRIEIIQVPLASPQDAKVDQLAAHLRRREDRRRSTVSAKDEQHGDGHAARRPSTDQCHDITVYPAIGLAAGACSGNGILLDIRNPAEPEAHRRSQRSELRLLALGDVQQRRQEGALHRRVGRWRRAAVPRDRPDRTGARTRSSRSARTTSCTLDGYFKLPAPQTETENCVAHNGSLIPVPGRDIMAQGWYQGGVSVFDFTDAAHPKEIAFFDRGPLDCDTSSYLGGYWSAYWYNGHIYGSEIARGLDIFELKPSQYLSQNEIDAAKLVHFNVSNPSDQPKLVWPAASSSRGRISTSSSA